MKKKSEQVFVRSLVKILGSALGPQGELPNTNATNTEHAIKVTTNLLTAIGRNVAHMPQPSHHNFLFKGVDHTKQVQSDLYSVLFVFGTVCDSCSLFPGDM